MIGKKAIGTSKEEQIMKTGNKRKMKDLIPSFLPSFVRSFVRSYIHTYVTLHYITLHYIKLHYITLHSITLHTMTTGCMTTAFVVGWASLLKVRSRNPTSVANPLIRLLQVP